MKLNINHSLLALLVSATAFALPAQAHELRNLGDGYIIQVGADVEPPVAGQPNGVDFFAAYETTPGNIETAVPIDRTKAGDEIEIHVTPIKLKREAFNSPVAKVYPIISTFQDTIIEETPALYSPFIFPTTGAYGYIVHGEIKKAGHPEKEFVERFVCGAGSQDVIFGTAFECVAH